MRLKFQGRLAALDALQGRVALVCPALVVLGGADGATGQLAALNLGVVLLHFGRAEEALVSYLEPGVAGILQPIVHYLRARAHQSLGKRRAARADLQAAARFQPSVLEPLNLPVSILSAEALAHPLK